ncbi:hypothetical protein LEP48_06740 [Isoptericola sp. NEAU-Y5]|uniref:Lipoprotein n=1 Tax=Isoptericola luteus TaxID=2879484 RepID=A0ABS7ZDD6_9MICO|nr:hypothetical protein [Isoptericola sp. NEAU-Y5]MCA5893051.1 hypothetical protein [Isoptericola sp. NEAU-Y5]
MSRSTRPARTAVAAASLAAGALLLAACAPVTTTLPYSPSDGARVNLNDAVRGLNLMVVSEGDGAPGTVYGALSNGSAEVVDFVLTAEGAAPLSVSVPAGGTVYLGEDEAVDSTIDAVDAMAGESVESTLSGAGIVESFSMQVFDGTLPEYATAGPTGS